MRSASPLKPLASALPTQRPATSKSSVNVTLQACSASSVKSQRPDRALNGPSTRSNRIDRPGSSVLRVVNAVRSPASRTCSRATTSDASEDSTDAPSHQPNQTG